VAAKPPAGAHERVEPRAERARTAANAAPVEAGSSGRRRSAGLVPARAQRRRPRLDLGAGRPTSATRRRPRESAWPSASPSWTGAADAGDEDGLVGERRHAVWGR
jgi:hypothetical protein